MKKWLFFFCLPITFLSCEIIQIWTCECTTLDTSSGVESVVTTTIEDTKSDAQTICEEKSLTIGTIETTCELLEE